MLSVRCVACKITTLHTVVSITDAVCDTHTAGIQEMTTTTKYNCKYSLEKHLPGALADQGPEQDASRTRSKVHTAGAKAQRSLGQNCWQFSSTNHRVQLERQRWPAKAGRDQAVSNPEPSAPMPRVLRGA